MHNAVTQALGIICRKIDPNADGGHGLQVTSACCYNYYVPNHMSWIDRLALMLQAMAISDVNPVNLLFFFFLFYCQLQQYTCRYCTTVAGSVRSVVQTSCCQTSCMSRETAGICRQLRVMHGGFGPHVISTMACSSTPSSIWTVIVSVSLEHGADILLPPCRRCYEIRCANMVFSDNYNETIDRRSATLQVVLYVTYACRQPKSHLT
jgi:hypothetical protein